MAYEVPAEVLEAYPNGLVVPLEGGGCAYCADVDSPVHAVPVDGCEGMRPAPHRIVFGETDNLSAWPVVWFCAVP